MLRFKLLLHLMSPFKVLSRVEMLRFDLTFFDATLPLALAIHATLQGL
jgi:hypothetical protein